MKKPEMAAPRYAITADRLSPHASLAGHPVAEHPVDNAARGVIISPVSGPSGAPGIGRMPSDDWRCVDSARQTSLNASYPAASLGARPSILRRAPKRRASRGYRAKRGRISTVTFRPILI
jgi:hypothetical protein